MIAHIQGKLIEKSPTEVIIDCNGVGYHINISLHTYTLLPNSDFVKLFTFLQIKEDAHSLFGFAEKSERENYLNCYYLYQELVPVLQERCCLL